MNMKYKGLNTGNESRGYSDYVKQMQKSTCIVLFISFFVLVSFYLSSFRFKGGLVFFVSRI